MTYKEFIENKKATLIGKKVSYHGNEYTVVDVDYNGMLLINRPHKYCDSYTAGTTAIDICMLDK